MGAVIGSFGISTAHWYGADPEWRAALEADARGMHGRRLHIEEAPTKLTYYHRGLHVPGRQLRVPARIEFHRKPVYETYGLEPHDYPRVFADPDARSKHRMADDNSLCLFFVNDPATKRWTSDKGLQSLIVMIADHLFHEDIWRETDEWPIPDAPHGFQ
ncbi:hypothetical protein EV187_0847 [Agromyces ramosus]|uniref:Type II CBASS E2 protein domain-containing protein n=1 Tax=Agromyces ramosus TaxID=33879 RepID=A0A4Q7MLR6_9MICO|nr:hypothetical protein [Agromyces ramosus]RZS68418.1 hypothetical protein EV187_0847 [Agromyces ramosus]